MRPIRSHKLVLWARRRASLAARILAALLSLTIVVGSLIWASAVKGSETKAQSLLETADQVLREMSDITGLPIKAPLKKQVVGRPEIKKYVAGRVEAEYTPRELHIQETALQAFGLVSRDFKLGDFLVKFYTEQAAGFYDPRLKTMFLADWPTEDTQKLALAHELTHALQDQNFDMEKFLRAEKENDDATSARQAVVEGYATAAMFQEMIGSTPLSALPSIEPLMAQVLHQQMQEFPIFNEAPYFFRRQALFPYSEGLGFMQKGLAEGGWQKLNRELFSHPPETTREIFHPELYFDHHVSQPKLTLVGPDSFSQEKDLELLADNTMGELGYYTLLGQFISEDEAKAVGKAWIQDRYLVYESAKSHRLALVARTRWSSSEQALSFFRDYHTILVHKYPELAPDKRSQTDLFIGTASNGNVILLRSGDECRWAEGVPAAQTESMLDYLKAM